MSQYTTSDHLYTNGGANNNEMNNIITDASERLGKNATADADDAKNNTSFQIQENFNVYELVSQSSPRNYIGVNQRDFLPLSTAAHAVNPPRKLDTYHCNDDLFRGSVIKPELDDVQYYRSLSRAGPILSDEYLPKSLPQKARNPIIVFEEQKSGNRSHFDEWEDSNNDDNELKPTGEWTSPVVKEALARQVSKERQFRTLWKNVARLFTAKLFLLVTEKIIQLYQMNLYGSKDMFNENFLSRKFTPKLARILKSFIEKPYLYSHYLLWSLLIVIMVSAVKFAWPQDQCWDLPLTNRQRELIGLKSCSDNEFKRTQENANLILSRRLFQSKSASPLQVPKYPRVNKLSEYIRRKENDLTVDDFSISLQDIDPRRRIIHSSPMKNASNNMEE
ncbi:hypothetical protein JCM33374_g5413 [Metschnikowia sp. JCM 33374]|nr:hypothetical protein JCM33374_g5413 [Metschnikowia sp. JCM 33374]